MTASGRLGKEKAAIGGENLKPFSFNNMHSCRLFSAFRSVSELVSGKSWVNIKDERRRFYFSTKQTSLVVKLVLLPRILLAAFRTL